ncbi:MAG TPA: TonB family protein [Stenotrophomonas sp.]|nr:TonB family protein [Stenotrophomonas sp.]
MLIVTVVLSMSCLSVLALRLPVRRRLGAGAAYGLWCLPPLCLLAMALPPPSGGLLPMHKVAGLSVALLGAVPARGEGAQAMPWLLLWALGVLACLCWQARRQHLFARTLGRLQRVPHARLPLYRAEHDAGLPALVGLLRPRIVLPPDFELRYSRPQRALLLRHENVHRRRGDLPCNAIATLLLCLQWFNPLAYWAVAAFRRDQEIACDARVLATRPGQRRLYGEAMLIAGVGVAPPLGCPWRSRHPLKERIEMLKQPAPATRQRCIGLLLVGLLAGGSAYATWAAQPAKSNAPMSKAAPREISQPYPLSKPAYPKDAFAKGQSGRVVLLVDVRADGSVENVVVKESQPAGVFDAVSVAAARQWVLQPSTKDGKAVAGRVQVPITFELDPPAADPAPGTALARR